MNEPCRLRRGERYGTCDGEAYQREQNAAENQGQERVSLVEINSYLGVSKIQMLISKVE